MRRISVKHDVPHSRIPELGQIVALFVDHYDQAFVLVGQRWKTVQVHGVHNDDAPQGQIRRFHQVYPMPPVL